MEPHVILERRRARRRLIFWRSATIVAVLALIVALMAETVPLKRPFIARVAVDNVIFSDSDREEALDELANDDDVQAVIVRIDSPGGTVTGSEELFLGLRAIAEKKPIVAVIGGVGASGGYIAAIAADYIIARETSITGSIGVVMESVEVAGLLETLGISVESIKSSRLKGEPSPFHALRPEVREALQSTIDDSYQWFKGLVQTRRGFNAEETEIVSDGRIFTGRQAIAVKLIDAIGGEKEAVKWLETEREIDRDLPVIQQYWGPEEELSDRLVSAAWHAAVRSAGKLTHAVPLDGLLSVWHPSGDR